MVRVDMLPTLFWGALAGGAIAWVWGAISWMALPWHHDTFLAFKDEEAIERAILAAAPASGVYGLPAPPRHGPDVDRAERIDADRRAQERMIRGPIVTAIVQRDGFGSVPFAMFRAFLIYAAASLVFTWILLQTNGGYWERVAIVTGVGLAAGLFCRLPDWNWHGYSGAYTIVQIADHLAGAALMGLALARLVR